MNTHQREIKMKKILFVSLITILFSANTFAKDETFAIDGKNIVVTDVSASSSGRLHQNELKNGVYIMVSNGPNIDSHLINAEKSIKSVFESYGIKTSDNMENSSIAIRWGSNLALDMVKADQQAANTLMPTHNQVASMSSQVIGAAMSGGVVGLAGFALGALYNTDSKLLIQAISYKDPVMGKVGLFGLSKGIQSSSYEVQNATVFYKLEKGKEASDDVVLKMAVDQWIKHFIVFDVPSKIQPEKTNIATITQVVSELVTAPELAPSDSIELTTPTSH